MKRHGVRWQIVGTGLTVLLIMVAVSVLEIGPTKAVAQDDAISPRLTALHRRGDLKQQQRHAAVLAAETAKIQPDCLKLSCIALTFDDGPNPVTTPQVVSILEAEHVSATFFMVGSRVPGNEALLRQMQADGDEIGNHSWSHPDLTKLSVEQIQQQIQLTQSVISAAGVSAPTLFRPPYGALNQVVTDAAKPLKVAFWNEDPKDWAARTPQQVLMASEAAAKAGGVVDMHDIYHVTADSLQPLIDNLKSRNFRFVTMSQLMTSYPSASEFYGGYRP